jgi:hypothetical protein
MLFYVAISIVWLAVALVLLMTDCKTAQRSVRCYEGWA